MQYAPFSSFLDASFFQTLAAKKLNEYKLDSAPQPLRAEYLQSQQSPRLLLDGESFDATHATQKPTPTVVVCPGTLLNVNTIEEFKAVDKKELLQQQGDRLKEGILNGTALKNPSLLLPFFLLTFCDLKKYNFLYWVAFPVPNRKWLIDETGRLEGTIESEQPAFLIDGDNTKPLEELQLLDRSQAPTIGFLDSSDGEIGWGARNLCFMLHVLGFSSAQIVSVRTNHRRVLTWTKDAQPAEPSWTGWEKNAHGKLLPKTTNLGPLLNPLSLASQAVDLNLKLMKWRIAPDLDLDTIKNTKCLLLGAGTLGSYVARSLLAWGVEHITFVDNGSVSFSNPVRQPLYTYEDCLDGGKPKAETAAAALKRIYPVVKAEGVTMEVPMIGHTLSEGSEERVKGQYDKLVELIEAHDAVFLLMDSRESRWLPAVICRALDKICITAAIGFDSFVVMRHGQSTNTLGCYFCNDVVAPTDSMNDRTLDQMCTVTRPGIAPIVSGYGVEILQSVTQDEATAPHQLRGFLHDFSTVKITGQAYKCCSACSPTVVGAWQRDKWEFVKRALNERGYVEELCGLAQLRQQVDDMELDDDDEDDWEL